MLTVMPIAGLLVISLFFVAGIWVVLTYNAFVRGRNTVRASWAQIDVELKRRHDLIPNLISTVQGYMDHERQTLTTVTAARAAAVSASGTGDVSKAGPAENALTQSLRSLFAVSENYPDLKASANFLDLQNQLTETENRIESARRDYNRTVQGYNTSVQSLPASLIAAPLGFASSPFFEADPSDRDPVQVRFTQNPPSAAA
jgi:LemA protein